MSEPSDEQAAMQHYLICGTEDCQKNGQFYCNACHRPLCEQCRDQHKKTMKLSFTETANSNFPWTYAKTIQHEIKNCFVENVAFQYVLNAP